MISVHYIKFFVLNSRLVFIQSLLGKSAGHSCRMSYRFLSLIMFKDKLLSLSSCCKSILLPVFTILVNRTTVKPVLKVRKLEVLLLFYFHLVSKSDWFHPPNNPCVFTLYVLTVRAFLQALSISCLIYCNSLTLYLPPILINLSPIQTQVLSYLSTI